VSSEFVRYAPEIETIDPDIDELLAQIIDYVEKRALNRREPRAPGGPSAARVRSQLAWSRRKSILRHQMNHQVCREPKNLAEVFGS
jgi:hypothetical protein